MYALEEKIQAYFEDCKRGYNNIITAEMLHREIEGNKDDLFLLDIRRKEDYEKGHINGSFHVFWHEVGDFLDVFPKDKKIVVACYTGQSAGQVVSLLKILGFDACSLQGGMLNGWLKGTFPIEEGCG